MSESGIRRCPMGQRRCSVAPRLNSLSQYPISEGSTCHVTGKSDNLTIFARALGGGRWRARSDPPPRTAPPRGAVKRFFCASRARSGARFWRPHRRCRWAAIDAAATAGCGGGVGGFAPAAAATGGGAGRAGTPLVGPPRGAVRGVGGFAPAAAATGGGAGHAGAPLVGLPWGLWGAWAVLRRRPPPPGAALGALGRP